MIAWRAAGKLAHNDVERDQDGERTGLSSMLGGYERQDMAVLNYALIGLGGAGAAFAVGVAARAGRILGWYDSDGTVRSAIDAAGGLSFEGLCGQGAVSMPLSAQSGASAVQGADIIMVSTTADRHAEVAGEIAPGLSSGQMIVLHCGYVGGSKVFADALVSAGASKDILVFELNNALHLAGKLNPSTVVIKGQKRWLELAGLPEGTEGRHYSAFLEQFPEFTYTPNVLESGLNNPNCIGHVPAYIAGAMTLDRDMGELTCGVLHFDEARMGRVNLIAGALEQERDAIMRAAGLRPLPTALFSQRAYPAGTRLFGAIPRFGPKLQKRFLYEDVPCSLVPLEVLARQVGVATPFTTALIALSNILEQVDFRATGRNEQVLPLDWMRSYVDGSGRAHC